MCGFTYQLQEHTFAPGDSWMDVGAAVAGQDEMITQSRAMSPGPAAEFFRLWIVPSP